MIKILVAFHKEYPHSRSPVFLNVHVGKQGSKNMLPFTGDNSGTHISDLNGSFCELTGLYWWWKNQPLPDVVGLAHYRRYFDFSDSIFQLGRKQRKTKVARFDFERTAKLHQDRIPELLKEADIILAQRTDLKESIQQHYLNSHIKEDWKLLTDVMRELHPTIDLSFFESTNTMHEFNMFVCRREQFIAYMDWLFPILFQVNERIAHTDHPYQKRVIGFMGERLLNFYVAQEKLRVREVPVSYLD